MSSSNIVSYTWTPSTFLDFPDIKSPTAAPSENVVYTIKVVDDFGCVILDSVRLLIQDEELLIPTAFSPNKDPCNDIFRVKNTNLSQLGSRCLIVGAKRCLKLLMQTKVGMRRFAMNLKN